MIDRKLVERAGALLLLLGFAAWLVHYMARLEDLELWLTLGSIYGPSEGYAAFIASYATWGLLGAMLGGVGLALLADGKLLARVPRNSAPLVLVFALGAFLWAAAIRFMILGEHALTDDESAYQFMAELLASGRLTAPSPPDPWFFDRIFMINDGRMFAQYFFGWPALMALGVWLGEPGYINAMLFAASVPALAIVLRSMVSRRWETLGILLFVSAPLMFFNAATQLSHTSSVFMIAWAHAFYVLGRKRPGAWYWHALCAAALGAGFFNRPLVFASMGLPLGLAWAWHALRGPARWSSLLAFLVTASVLGAAFFAVNIEHSGSLLATAYHYYYDFSRANDYRYSSWAAGQTIENPELVLGDWKATFRTAKGASALLVTDMFGWPLSYLFLPIALPAARFVRALRLPLAMLAVFLLAHVNVSAVGVDSFGPVHFTEVTWPMVLITVVTTRWLGHWLARRARRLRYAPLGVVTMSITASYLLYFPVRSEALNRISVDLDVPHVLTAAAGVHHAIVFAPYPFTPRCDPTGGRKPPHHYSFWRPNNDPDLKNDILWVNHLSVERDRELLRSFPDRAAYWLGYDKRECKPYFVPLSKLGASSVPPGHLRFVAPTRERPFMSAEIYYEHWRNADGTLQPLPHPVRENGKLVVRPVR